MPLSAKQMVKLLKKNGFEELRQNGTSHLKMINRDSGRIVTVPMHTGDLKKGLEQAILKEAGIKKNAPPIKKE
ncbi:MAG: type II toxin-antitoxin system HicA family toxin [Clostridia bacterium]|nr:type II toxin-antitoxin system HicA family toxin [Clostridia bacterium]